jgi:hypothetical protein
MHDAQRWFNPPFACSALAIALGVTLAGCGDETGAPSDGQDRELYDEAIAGNAYKSWAQFPGASPDLNLSGQHNNTFVRSFMNDVAVAAIADFDGSFPEGTILVKEQYEDAEGKVLSGHTVMLKIDGYDSEHGDWYWVAYDGKGKTTQFAGTPKYCWECHTGAMANDWVFTSFK